MADAKLTALTADASPTSDDLLYLVNDPAGTPGSKKATAANVITKAHGLSDGAVVSVASSVLVTNQVTSSAAELNILDGATLTVTELNYVDGVTSAIQTQLDGKQAADADLTTLATAFTSASASGPASLAFHEDTDNGTNKITIQGVASVASDKVLTLPDATDTLVGKATTDVLTNKSIDADTNTITNIENADIKAAAAIAVNKLAALTASELVVTDASGFLTTSAGVTATEAGYLNGVTSAIQTQIDGKQPLDTDLTTLSTAFTSASASGAAKLAFHEDTDNGTNKAEIQGPASLAGDIVITLPGTAGTLALTSDVDDLSGVTDAATARTNLGLGTAATKATDLADLNEATIETAIDTLANLTSVQGLTVTLSDAGADAIFGWDDSAAAYENLTAAEATAVLNNVVGDSGAGGTKGLVPAPAAGDAAANKFLKADGTWTAPAGSGDFVGPASSTDNAVVRFDGTTGKLGQNSGLIVSDTQDITAYDATNDGNPVFAFGASATERVTVTPTYDTGAQTLDYVKYATDVASATADKGLHRFNVDGADVLDIDDGGINFAASKGISIAGTDIITDSAGTATLSNIDALDANTEATIEAAIDTLANLTSVQGRTVTLADAGANAIFGWDDAAGAYENLTQAEVLAVIGDSSLTAKGVVELATAAETTTGTDATRAVTPDGLAGSDYGKRVVGIMVSDPNGDAITTGDGKAYFRVPSVMNGWNLVEVAMSLTTASSSGIPTVQIRNSTQAADMLTTKLTIDASETDSSTAAAAAVIDTANDDVATGDKIHIDIDVAGTGAKGLFVELIFQLP